MDSLKRILITTDFSKNADVVFKYAQWLAESQHLKIDLLHVIPKLSYLEITEEVMGNPFKTQEKYKTLRKKLEEKLNVILKKYFQEENRGEVLVSDGVKIAEGIREHCVKDRYGVVLIGSRGQGNSIFKKGSITEKLVRISPVPVLSFRQENQGKPQKVVMPTDGSGISFQALKLALNFAVHSGAKLELYSVVEFDAHKIAMLGGDPNLLNYIKMGQEKEIKKHLEDFLEQEKDYQLVGGTKVSLERIVNVRVKDQGTVQLSVKFEEGVSAHQTIVDYADKNSDLVIMTTHGRSGLSKFLIGSVAEKVVRHLEVPVMTIKPDFGAENEE